MSAQRSSLREAEKRDGDNQHLDVMKAMWDTVDKFFDSKFVLTEAGHNLIQTYSIKAAHHELPYVMHFLAMMCSLVNGAKTPWFPSNASPMFLFVLNVNYTQTRKSSLTGNGDEFGDRLDAVVRDVVAAKVGGARPPEAGEAAEGAQNRPRRGNQGAQAETSEFATRSHIQRAPFSHTNRILPLLRRRLSTSAQR